MPQNQVPRDKVQRAFVSGRFELEIDGASCGILHSVDGANFKSEAIGEKVGGDGLVTRYPGRQKFEDITFSCGASMTPNFWTWIRESIQNKPSRRNGAIVALDFDGYERSRRTFIDALVSEIQFPALDAKGREPKRFTIKLAPEQISYNTEGRKANSPVGYDIRPQKKVLPANFSLRLDGIERHVTGQVNKIEAMSVKQNIIDNPMGGLLFMKREAGRVEFPNLTFTLPEAFVQPFMSWWEEFVGRGNHVHAKERNGSITYLDSTTTVEIATITLNGVGITGISLDKHDGHTEAIRMAKVDCYVESLDFQFKA